MTTGLTIDPENSRSYGFDPISGRDRYVKPERSDSLWSYIEDTPEALAERACSGTAGGGPSSIEHTRPRRGQPQ
jgi:hypothetical protein